MKKLSLVIWIQKLSIRRQKEDQRRRIETYQRALNFAAGSLSRRVLRSWNRNILDHKRILYVKEMETRKVRTRIAFVVWRNYLRLRDREYAFRSSSNQRHLGCVWRRWKSRTGNLRRLAGTISDQFATRRNASVVQSGFRKWKSQWIRTLRARTRYRDSILRRFFQKWKATAAERGLDGTANAVCRKWMTRRAWSTWKDRIFRITKERRIELVVERVRKRELNDAFTAFRNYVRKKHATRNVIATVLPRMAKIRHYHSSESHVSAKVYCPWLMTKTFFTWKRQLKIRQAKSKEMDSTAVAYRSAIEWRIQRRAMIRWQSKLAGVLQKRRVGMLRRMAFVRWHQWSQSRKAMKMARMAQVFDRWQDHIQSWRGNASAAASFDSKSVTIRAFHQWRAGFLKLTQRQEVHGSRVAAVEEQRVSNWQKFDRQRVLKRSWMVWTNAWKAGIFDRERKLIYADTWADLSLKRRTIRTLAAYLCVLRNENGSRIQGKEKEPVELDVSEERSMRFRTAQRVLMKVGGP